MSPCGCPVVNGDPATGASDASRWTRNTDSSPEKSATYRNRPTRSVAIPPGNSVGAPMTNGEPGARVKVPARLTRSTVTVAVSLLLTNRTFSTGFNVTTFAKLPLAKWNGDPANGASEPRALMANTSTPVPEAAWP